MDILAQMQSTFSTPRLELNLLSEDDRQFVFELVNTEGWLQFIGDRKVRSLDDAANYIQKIKGTPDLFYWVVRLKEEQTPIGIVSFLKRGYLEHFDLGFAFLPQFNGKGYAYEASKEVLAFAKTQEAYPIVLATTVPGNRSSIGLLNRLGFSLEKQMEVNGETLQIYRAE
jgi:[ribosomal protein S5]-alanine N-acetyltransferase